MVSDEAAAAAAGEIVLPVEQPVNQDFREHKVPAAVARAVMEALGAPEEEGTFVGNPTRHPMTVFLEMRDSRD